MKILYYSVHAILEYDEVSLFRSMGHAVFPLGTNFRFQVAEPFRPALVPTAEELQLVDAFDRSGSVYGYGAGAPSHHLTPDFIDEFDLIVVMHDLAFIEMHWDVLSRRPVIWRTIGQGVGLWEDRVAALRDRGMHVVRYSPVEQRCDPYAGADAVIRFSKDEDDMPAWSGEAGGSLCFANHFRDRYPIESSFFEAVVGASGVPMRLGGIGNDTWPYAIGLVTFDEQKELFRTSGNYFYCSGLHIPYTLNFMEAWMAGIPIVAVDLGLSEHYEIPDLIKHGSSGFIVRTEQEAAEALRALAEDSALAAAVGLEGRQRATGYFGRKQIAPAWGDFFARLTAS